MKSLPVVAVILIVLFEIHYSFSEVDPNKSCRSTVQDLTKLQLQLVAKCSKKLKFKNGKEKSKKQNCILRCAMIEAELTNQDGQVTPDSVDYLLQKFVPAPLVDRANKTFYPCMEIGFNEPFKTPEEDPFCLTYDPFVKCFMQKASSFCP